LDEEDGRTVGSARDTGRVSRRRTHPHEMTGIHRELHILWRSVLGGTLLMVPGVLGYIVDNLWLFPSLGPSLFLLVISPHEKSSRIYNVFVGHLIAIVCGYIAVIATGAGGIPSELAGGHILVPHILASGIAMGLMIFLQLSLKAAHVPGASTALLITLGAFKVSWHDFMVILVGVVIMAIVGETARRFLLWKEPDIMLQ
jgi:hypothetical protein